MQVLDLEKVSDKSARLLGEYVELLHEHGVDSMEERQFVEEHGDEEFKKLAEAARQVKRYLRAQAQ